MIVFHGDHLVPPVLCKLVYALVPEELHIPVVFRTSPGEYPYTMGCCHSDWIEVNLNRVLFWALKHNWAPSVAAWWGLLRVCLHEFGHVPQRGCWPCSGEKAEYLEGVADQWAFGRIWRLAEVEERLYQPPWLGYLSLCIHERCDEVLWEQAGVLNPADLKQWRWIKEQHTSHIRRGQLSTGDVVSIIFAQKDERKRRLVRRLGHELADHYCDPSTGKRHLYFTFGDCLRITERVIRHTSGNRAVTLL